MKLTPSSMARRRTAIAAPRSFGGPQIPSPVMRIAPKPRRLTVSSPPSETVPLAAADKSLLFPFFSFIFILQNTFMSSDDHSCDRPYVGLLPSPHWLAPVTIARLVLRSGSRDRAVRQALLQSRATAQSDVPDKRRRIQRWSGWK